MTDSNAFDVVVCGGGMAGLTLARQLRMMLPKISVAVIDRLEGPFPDACHKVGESVSEVGSYYLAEVLKLRPYLDDAHLVKNGIRFFCGQKGAPLAARQEVGPAEHPRARSYQLDRGRLENDLRRICLQDGVTLLEGCSVHDIVLSSRDAGPHHIVVDDLASGERRTLEGTWVVDAMSRRRLIQTKLGLGAETGIHHSSSWFRVAGRVDVNDLVPQAEERWHSRDVDKSRYLSTCHLVGEGYWVWIIPLVSNHTSIGIVADMDVHPYATFSSQETAFRWLAEHEPGLAEHLSTRVVEDFGGVADYSYATTKIFSSDRWACCGEAAAFVDPLYSPGADFIAYANTFAAQLIEDDLTGTLDPARVEELNAAYVGYGSILVETFRHTAKILGNPDTLAAKVYWDTTHYWAFMSQYFIQGIYTLPAAELARYREILGRWGELNLRAQAVLRSWADLSPTVDAGLRPNFVPMPHYPSAIADLHLGLLEKRSAEETLQQMRLDLATGEEVVHELLIRALRAVGPAVARRLADDVSLAGWPSTPSAARIELDEYAGTDRRRRLPRIARELERTLGRPSARDPKATLQDLLRAAGALDAAR